jgi:hypothetical protein
MPPPITGARIAEHLAAATDHHASIRHHALRIAREHREAAEALTKGSQPPTELAPK